LIIHFAKIQFQHGRGSQVGGRNFAFESVYICSLQEVDCILSTNGLKVSILKFEIVEMKTDTETVRTLTKRFGFAMIFVKWRSSYGPDFVFHFVLLLSDGLAGRA
jgi:hypothetical protein